MNRALTSSLMWRLRLSVAGVMLFMFARSDLSALELAPGQLPVPRSDPAMPTPTATASLTPDQRLLADLERRLLRLDGDIAERAHGGQQPPPPISADPRLSLPRREREAALRALRAALESIAARTAKPADALDGADPRRHPAESASLGNANALAIAECYRDLVAAAPADGSADDALSRDLSSGSDHLLRLERSRLSAAETLRADYLDLWFAAEHARYCARARPTDVGEKLSQAVALRDRFLANYPDSPLALSAQALLAGMSATAASTRATP